jgi:hypothetical protein
MIESMLKEFYISTISFVFFMLLTFFLNKNAYFINCLKYKSILSFTEYIVFKYLGKVSNSTFILKLLLLWKYFHFETTFTLISTFTLRVESHKFTISICISGRNRIVLLVIYKNIVFWWMKFVVIYVLYCPGTGKKIKQKHPLYLLFFEPHWCRVYPMT